VDSSLRRSRLTGQANVHNFGTTLGLQVLRDYASIDTSYRFRYAHGTLDAIVSSQIMAQMRRRELVEVVSRGDAFLSHNEVGS
jgi:hypothetical protein